MNKKIEKLLRGENGNRIMPFFWQHGEDECVLRRYMEVIEEGNMGSVCIESRPHPDFCGPLWWRDMDIILDEARRRKMKVWILDDSHFPTGYANGALENGPDELCRQSLYYRRFDVEGREGIVLNNVDDLARHDIAKSEIEKRIITEPYRSFDDDRLQKIVALYLDSGRKQKPVDLTPLIDDGRFVWRPGTGMWRIYITSLTRNAGPHRNYINMLDGESVDLLIRNVYEPHYERYNADFGNTIAGFFSDEPELGNYHLYETGNVLGTDQDLPWGRGMSEQLESRLGSEWALTMPLLWEENFDKDLTARVRYAYMDSLTGLVEKNFSERVGNWCRSHGVEYIGHLIEDDNQHCRTGSSLGHFFRGLSGQDMAGIDDIGGQVQPQGEDFQNKAFTGNTLDGEFYHYALGKLGDSLGAIDPLKKGRVMCEIFGAYGWSEGVRLEKYLIDHFVVRGVNHFVPHSFSPKPFPDPDCPPHFYAHGNNPQYRHFGKLMAYANRLCELFSGGGHIADVAILYHGEGEWSGKTMLMQKPARILADRQIDFDFIPTDVFLNPHRYRTDLAQGLTINARRYKVLLIPGAEYVSVSLLKGIEQIRDRGTDVFFLESRPRGVYDGESFERDIVECCPLIGLDALARTLDLMNLTDGIIWPEDNRIRIRHYDNGNDYYLLVNEGSEIYRGTLELDLPGPCYAYDAWSNRTYEVNAVSGGEGIKLSLEIEPLKSIVLVFDGDKATNLEHLCPGVLRERKPIDLDAGWERSICSSLSYPEFLDKKKVNVPDSLEEERPDFSGFVRYERSILADTSLTYILEITDAAEGVEVFVNGRSLGIQIVPTYLYDLTPYLEVKDNRLVIEVATTLEREVGLDDFRSKRMGITLKAKSGITGHVRLWKSAVPGGECGND